MGMLLQVSNRLQSAAQLGARLHIVDGVQTNRTDEGLGTLRPTGILAPLTAPTAAVAAGGACDVGVHTIYVTFVYVRDGAILLESNPSPGVSATCTAGNQTINLTNIPTSTHPNVTGRRIYMTRAGGTDPLALTTGTAEIANNTATTYSISVADASLSAISLSYKNAVFPTGAFNISFGGRLLVAGAAGKSVLVTLTNASATFTWVGGPILTNGDVGKNLYEAATAAAYTILSINESAQTGTLSVAWQGTTSSTGGTRVTIIDDLNGVTIGNALPFNIEGWDINGDAQFQVNPDDGMYLRGMSKFHQTLLFGKSRAIYQLYGDLITDKTTTGPSYRVEVLTDKVGFASHWSAKNLRGGGVIFYSGDGVYLLDGTQPIKVTDQIDQLFDDNNTTAIMLGGEDCRVDHSYDDQSHAIYDPIYQRFLLWVARKGNASTLTKPLDLCIMLDFKKKNSSGQPAAWAFLIPASISHAYEDEVNGIFRMFIGTYHSKILEMFVGFRDGLPLISTGSTNFLFKVTAITAPASGLGTLLTLSSTAPYGGYQDVTGGTPGLPIVGVSGARKGKLSILKSVQSGNKVEIDEDLYGTNPFAVNDIVTIGGYQAVWSSNQEAFGSEGVIKRGSWLKPTYNIPSFTTIDT